MVKEVENKQTSSLKKKTSKKSSKTSKVTASPAPVQEPVPAPVVETPVVDVPVPVSDTNDQNGGEPDIRQNFKDLLDKLASQANAIKTLTSEVKRLEKRVTKEFKEASRKNKKGTTKKNTDKPKRAPSGFAKPSPISNELSSFLGKSSGIEMARTEVTKYITQYIKDHGLQNPDNKRHILPDSKLKNLLNVKDNDEVTYFNLQKYMKHHFPKTTTTA